MDKVDEATAAQEFERFASAWRIDTDTDSMDEDSREGFEQQRRRLVGGIRKGYVRIGEDAAEVTVALEFAPEDSTITELTMRPPNGRALLQWDKFKDREQMHKLNTFLGACTGQSPAVFGKMDARDLKPFQTVATLFLAS